MPETRYSTGRENPGLRNASWNKPRAGLQDVQEIAGAREWVEPNKTRDDVGELRIIEPGMPRVDPSDRRPAAASGLEAREFGPDAITEQERVVNSDDKWAACDLCRRSAGECAVLVELHSGHICDQCTEEAVDAVRSELPKRRLRLAMERMLAGEVSIETVEMIEKMSGGST